jgi:hypothetical protein
MRTFFRKLYYYRDVLLWTDILRTMIVVAAAPASLRLSLLDSVPPSKRACPEVKLVKYVTFVYFVMGRVFIRPRCFTNAVTVSRIYKRYGYDAKIVFGCFFEKDKLKGHCWVERDGKPVDSKFRTVFSYPS